jgi:hypothetical protein
MKVVMDKSEIDELIKNFEDTAEKLIFQSSLKAHRMLAVQSAQRLKAGLSIFGGKRATTDYRNSNPFEMPLAHTFNLMDSIGYRVSATAREQFSEVGANVNGQSTADYAKYLDDGSLDGMGGIRPFLWYISDFYTIERWETYFNEIFNTLKWQDFEAGDMSFMNANVSN